LIGAKIQTQVAQLSDTLPATIENAKRQLNQSTLGKQLVENVSSPRARQNLQSVAQTFFRTTFGVFGDVYIVLFIGIFLTISPLVYKKGVVQLVPKRGQPVAGDLLDKCGENLKKWLKGKIFSMFVVFILTAIGLLIIGLPMWLVLALIAGILSFIPNFGPLIAVIPAVLVALLQGPETAAIVAGLYVLVQLIESNVITPKVQEKLINIPPALLIIAQMLVAPLTGGWGLLLATPMMIIIIVFVEELYIKKQNG
jgi:predicted PurR-regulated permease PerM